MFLCWYDHLTMMRYIRCNRWPGLGLGSGQRANAFHPGKKMQIFWWKADKGFPNCRAINQNPKWANSGAPHRNATHKQALFHTQAQNAFSFVSNFKTNNTQSYFFLILFGEKNPTRKMLMDSSCVLQVGRTNGYIGLAFSYTDLPIGTVVQAQLYSFWTRTSYLKSNINCDWYQMALLRGLMLMESLTVQIYIWTMQVLSLIVVVLICEKEIQMLFPDVERKKFHLAVDTKRNIEVQVSTDRSL